MHIEDVIQVLADKVTHARDEQARANTPELHAMWRNYESGYVAAVMDIFGRGAALRIERRIAGRADDETA